MTGPPYPPAPVAGSNAVGSFTIGVSPIGDIPQFNYWSTIISQYANSAVLTQLIGNFFQYLDQTADVEAFFDDMFNVDTASGYGLDVWGRIVGVVRTLHVGNAGRYLGFDEAGVLSADPLNQSPFYVGTPLTTNFQLSDDAFRVLIFAKALANISNGSSAAINQLLLNLFPGRGNCYVADGLNMTMQYVFAFQLSTVEQAILGQSGVLPKPVGVAATVVVL